MPFQTGVDGQKINRAGRKKGSQNKVGAKLRKIIFSFLNRTAEQTLADFKTLEPRDRVRIFVELLQYAVPKLQSVSAEVNAPQQVPQIFLSIDPNDKPIGTGTGDPEGNTSIFSES